MCVLLKTNMSQPIISTRVIAFIAITYNINDLLHNCDPIDSFIRIGTCAAIAFVTGNVINIKT